MTDPIERLRRYIIDRAAANHLTFDDDWSVPMDFKTKVEQYALEHDKDQVLLPLNCSAEFNTCGSCKFFDRDIDSGGGRYYAMHGSCQIKLPPHIAWKEPAKGHEEDDWQSPNKVKDADRCDFYKNDGRRYIVQRALDEKKP